MPLLKEENYTIEDIYALPEGERAELIDGQIYYMAPPSRKHQDISGELYADIKSYIRSHGGNCKVYAAPFAVYLDEATNTYVEPDISVICNPNKLDDKGCTGAPDWIIEVVSPASRRMANGSFVFVKISTSFIENILREALCTVRPVQQIA